MTVAVVVGGYDADFCEQPRDELICPICMLLARNAVVSPDCGHLFCKECLCQSIKRRNECPVCRAALMSLDIQRDVRAQREIGNLQVYCTFRSSGCGWKGPLSKFQSHLNTSCCYRQQATKRLSEKCSQTAAKLECAAATIQAVFRGFSARKRVKSILSAQTKEDSLQNAFFLTAMQKSLLLQEKSIPSSSSDVKFVVSGDDTKANTNASSPKLVICPQILLKQQRRHSEPYCEQPLQQQPIHSQTTTQNDQQQYDHHPQIATHINHHQIKQQPSATRNNVSAHTSNPNVSCSLFSLGNVQQHLVAINEKKQQQQPPAVATFPSSNFPINATYSDQQQQSMVLPSKSVLQRLPPQQQHSEQKNEGKHHNKKIEQVASLSPTQPSSRSCLSSAKLHSLQRLVSQKNKNLSLAVLIETNTLKPLVSKNDFCYDFDMSNKGIIHPVSPVKYSANCVESLSWPSQTGHRQQSQQLRKRQNSLPLIDLSTHTH